MRGFSFLWRMNARRKASCLLVLLFSAVVTLFLLIYPHFIQNSQKELDFAYDSIPVTGWIMNIKDYADPTLPAALWNKVLDTGYIGEHDSYSTVRCRIYSKEELALPENTTEEERLSALEQLLQQEKDRSRNGRLPTAMARGINRLQAEPELRRQKDTLLWLEGYDESNLTGDLPICLLPEELGWLPGDRVPVYLASTDVGSTTVCLMVAGIYPKNISNNVDMILPLAGLEKIRAWTFYINGFSFTVSDNRNLPALKAKLLELELNGASQLPVRVAIDDRILDGTISPIRGNLAMLKGLYRFFFVMVAAIGFFLCFLLVRGRKAEFAIMRMLGESRLKVTLKILLEQAVLCLLGILLSATVLLLAGQGAADAAVCAGILGSYIFGAGFAVLLTIRMDVMEILRDKE